MQQEFIFMCCMGNQLVENKYKKFPHHRKAGYNSRVCESFTCLPFNKIFFPMLVKLRFFNATINHNYEEIFFPRSQRLFCYCIACTE